MTKPSNFIMNSDYLSLAQTDSNELTAYFPPEHFEAGSQNVRTRDFTVRQSQGAIDMFMISLNNADYVLGADLLAHEIGQGDPPYYMLDFLVLRTGPSTIQVQLHEACYYTGGFDMPMQTVKVKVSSFKPPNLF